MVKHFSSQIKTATEPGVPVEKQVRHLLTHPDVQRLSEECGKLSKQQEVVLNLHQGFSFNLRGSFYMFYFENPHKLTCLSINPSVCVCVCVSETSKGPINR